MVRVGVNEDEKYPFYFTHFPDDPVDPDARFHDSVELSEEDAAAFRKARDEFMAWQVRVGQMVDEQADQRAASRRASRPRSGPRLQGPP